ncbi:MAG: DNA glycosylase AlkZ-like family protein [Enterobacter hormaechei]
MARSPYLVLFSRLGNYPPQWLDNALSQGELMEYWAHEACFLRAAILHWCVTACSPRTKWAGNTAGMDGGTRG